ncbi:MAG: HAMP domain-containing histidine kinase [Rhodospirillales bacterium]|nr:HAMP domain-containing histidine kinase [Rhodospirillales bacterium]MBO6788373.1 HAMP domain-containing histidine kinase [Rhodospirillales bacterium]
MSNSRPKSLIRRLAVWSLALLALSIPVFWIFFSAAVDKVSRDVVDTRLLEFADQVRGYGVSLMAEKEVDLPDQNPSNLRVGAGSADVDWVWQITPENRPPVRSDLLALSDTSLPVSPAPPATGFALKNIQSTLGSIRVAERIADEPLPFDETSDRDRERVHYIVGIRKDRYDGYVADHVARLERLAYIAVIPVVLALLGISVLIIASMRRDLVRLEDAMNAYEQGLKDRVTGEFPKELQSVADRINALLAHNDRLIERTRKYVSKIAHDINHPIAIIKNALDGNGDKDLMSRQLTRMEGLVDRYSSLARAIGPEGTARQRTQVAEVLEDTVGGFSILYRRSPLAFEVNCPSDLSYPIPRHDLEAMVANLVSNAHKYGDSKVVIAATALDGDGIRIVVDDDGPGIPEAERTSAVNWGKRLDEAPPGTGFGLAIVQDIAELYQGRVSLAVSPMGGLSAIIELPGVRN